TARRRPPATVAHAAPPPCRRCGTWTECRAAPGGRRAVAGRGSSARGALRGRLPARLRALLRARVTAAVLLDIGQIAPVQRLPLDVFFPQTAGQVRLHQLASEVERVRDVVRHSQPREDVADVRLLDEAL